MDRLVVDPEILVPKRWDAATTREALAAAETIAAVPAVVFEADELEPPLRSLAEVRGWKAGDLFMAIRVAVTGRTGPTPVRHACCPRPGADARTAAGSDRPLERSPAAVDGRERRVNEPRRCCAADGTHDPRRGRRADATRAVVDALEADGFRVIAAADGREALTRFRADKPDLVLLDLMLPELSGVEVCRIIRAGIRRPDRDAHGQGLGARQGRWARARGGRLRHEALQPARAVGPDRALFRRAEQAAVTEPPANVEIGDVQVDLGGHRLLRDGVPLPVKPKAFELLAFLLRHPGQVFTRDQLLERVWGYDYAGETRTVDVHIHWLRSQLERDPSMPQFIHTVRGVGYVFRRPA